MKRRIYRRYRTGRKKGGQRYWVGRNLRKNYGMGFTKMLRVKTPKAVTFYGIDELQKGEKRGPVSDFDYNVERIKRDADTLLTYKDKASGKIKRSDDPFWKGRYHKKELGRMDKEEQQYAMKKYQEGLRIKGLKKIQPVGIVRLSRGETSHGAVDEKGSKDWEKELEETMDIPFTKKIVQMAGHKQEDVKVEDVTKEFKGMTPSEAYKKAFPKIEIVSPEDPFIELTPASYNKSGKKGDFQIRGQGPYGTIDEIKKTFPGKKVKIKWKYATEEVDDEA